ncbi:AP-4 complex subunit epsilon-1-like isoform X2 [Centruroides vittatus]|uniref:AP-4 complex subunit epsilon-1-like isoform X2 n=1 Tax=Centruroides vittatus TaxID=120091 RepID=UPI00350F0713
MEKTLESLQRVLTSGSSHRRFLLPMIGNRKRYGDFVERLRIASSKHEEDELIKNKLLFLQNQLTQPNITLDDVEECLLYAMYCETLGYDCSFTYIHSLKLAQQGNLHQKMIGYVAASIFLNKDHELVILLINTIQKDLKSSNIAEICMALITVCHLINHEMVPTVQNLIEEKLNHSHPLVRKFAVLAFQHCLNQLQNWHISSAAVPKLEKALSDGDLSVVTSAISTLKQLTKVEPTLFVHLISSLVQIQNQLIHRKLPIEFEYHNIPSPWLQIQILQLLSILGKYDPQKGIKIYPVVKETLQRAEVNQNISYAIIFECIETIINLHHDNEEIFQLALTSVAKLLKSKRVNLKYMGIKALAHVAKKVHPHFANEHQEIVMECLHHPDIAMRIQTLDLLYAMANPANVQIICEKMMDYLSVSSDPVSRKSIANKISELAFQFHPDMSWLITTINKLLFVASENVPVEIVYKLMKKIKNSSDLLKIAAFKIYSELCDSPDLPFQLVYIISWIFGEMWCYCETESSNKTQENLCKLLSKNLIYSEEIQLWILSAMIKVILNSGSVSEQMKSFIQRYQENKYQLIQQKVKEILRIIENIQNILPLCEQTRKEKIDPTLSFVDSFVCEALESGAAPYKPQSILNLLQAPTESEADILHTEEFQFNIENSDSRSDSQSIVCSPSYHSLCSENFPTQERSDHVRAKIVWTREGRLKEKSMGSASSSFAPSNDKQTLQTTAQEEELCKALFAGTTSMDEAAQKKEDRRLMFKKSLNASEVKEMDDVSSDIKYHDAKLTGSEEDNLIAQVLRETKIDDSSELSVKK